MALGLREQHFHQVATTYERLQLRTTYWASCPADARTLQVAGPPGNAFELVYGGVTDRVRANMQAADPVLQGWIRCGAAGAPAGSALDVVHC